MSSNAPAPTHSNLVSPSVSTGKHQNASTIPERQLTHNRSFGQTNQTWVLGEDASLPAVVNNLRDACAFASTILGNVSAVDSELPSSTSTPSPTPTSSNGGSYPKYSVQTTFVAIVLLLFVLGL